jgi:hypothetical protein
MILFPVGVATPITISKVQPIESKRLDCLLHLPICCMGETYAGRL